MNPRVVLLIGTYHMGNPGRDIFNVEADDVRSPHRQREIIAVVEALRGFAPTVVAVEHPFGSSHTSDRYSAYRRDHAELAPDEAEQIGFRLAAACDARIVPVDVGDEFGDPTFEDVAMRTPEGQEFLAELMASGERGTAAETELIARSSVGAVLRALNSPEVLRETLMPYLRCILPVADGAEYPGATMIGNWYRRNAKIVANIVRTTAPGDRIAMIYGQGHVPVLVHLMDGSGVFELVDLAPLLAEL